MSKLYQECINCIGLISALKSRNYYCSLRFIRGILWELDIIQHCIISTCQDFCDGFVTGYSAIRYVNVANSMWANDAIFLFRDNGFMNNRWGFLALALTVLTVPTAAEAQFEISSRASSIQIGGRAHAQYAASSVSDVEKDFFLRRVRLIADI